MTEPAVAEAVPLLDIRDLHVAFRTGGRDVPAVRGVNLTVYPGQTVAIVGESGSGKSTTAHAIIDLLPGTGRITAGEIRFGGTDLTRIGRAELRTVRGRRIGLVPQDPMSNLNPVWTIGFQLEETLAAHGIAQGKAARVRAAELLAEAGIADAADRLGQYPHQFSGGMRQRALIAMGLSCRPELLIADEPTSALDVTVQRQILDRLAELAAELGTAVLLITHDLGLAAERAEHLVVMYRGTVVESGPAQTILRDPVHEYTRRLVAAAPSLAAQRESTGRTRARIRAQAMRTAEAHAEDDRTELLVARNLVKHYRIPGSVPWRHSEFIAVDDVSFTLDRGTTTAVVGESGSGKSTVAQLVLGLLPATAGTVSFEGTDVATLKGKAESALRRRVQPIFQNPYGSLNPMYSIFTTIEEPLRVHGIGTRAERAARVRELLDRVALPRSVEVRYPSELSGGQRQRVAIARALALQPDLVVCDEAVSALDVLVQAQILDLLGELQSDLGLTYLFISHDLAVVRQIADRVLVMRQGRIVEAASTQEVFDHPREEYTRRLLDAIPGSRGRFAQG
ncbi:ABC transporter ATP-binding protein [Nocardia stercoris]|uniref:ABC transporter ATP-binding protein n=1 Tax=Nocardia stercoris TaxID=2483361 RepID=A0A3M2KVS7_9NOCA|nr:ABC transporter ATP-binding protein [Nocardia stercoris]RMI29301.1 ABC transporter ATP-binding protein [Nocardia stercoris]